MALTCVAAAVLGIVLDLLLEVGTVEIVAEAAADIAVEAAAEIAAEAGSCKCKSYWASRHVVPCPHVGHPLEW